MYVYSCMYVCVQAQVPAGLGCVLILTGEEQESAPYNLDGIEVLHITLTCMIIIIIKKKKIKTKIIKTPPNQQIKKVLLISCHLR